MRTPTTINHNGVIYDRASFVELGEFLTTAAAPRSEKEWQQFAQDLYRFYEDQLESMHGLEDAAGMLGAVDADIKNLQNMYAQAQRTMDIRVLRDLLEKASMLLNRDIRPLLPALTEQYQRLSAIKAAKVAHEKLKKQVSQARGMKKWF